MPITLKAAVAILAAQAACVAALAAYLIYADLAVASTDLRFAIGVTLFTLGFAAALGFTARGLARLKVGARGAALALELLLAAPASYMIRGDLAWLGWTVTALALGVIVLVLAPSTGRALGVSR